MIRRLPAAFAVLLSLAPSAALAPESGVGAAGSQGPWIRVDYGPLVDRRQLSHSGESVGALLRRLGGRPLPSPGERPADLAAYRLLEPILEPYGFLLPDVLDSLASAPDPPLVEVGWLYQPGAPQPAWADLLRSRRLVVESDGRGRFRVCLPWAPSRDGTAFPPLPLSADSAEAAREAWQRWWPVIRHVLAAEQRRLARARGGIPEGQKIEVAAHAFVHDMATTTFYLGRRPHRTVVTDTGPGAGRPPLDLRALASFLESGERLEGARLEPDGSVLLFGSRSASPPRMLGGPVLLSDLAVAFRAVFHGGLSEPYMSLDRDLSPWTSIVTYGGRLEDTRIGLVSLLCDIRFKTFSLGLDILRREDLRPLLRRELPSFRTHLERLAADPGAHAFAGQQTRLWFYPDDVEITLSEEADLFALRRARMTASSERVVVGTSLEAAEGPDPPWTRETIAAINQDYDALSRVFPELADLDQVVRLLALFTWLERVGEEGLTTPDLDVLLAVELPAVPTPRRLPNLIVHGVLPGPGAAAAVDVFDRVELGEAFDRLAPLSGRPLPAARRLARAAAALDPKLPDHAALAREIEEQRSRAVHEEDLLDLPAYRAERLLMHQRVLSTLDARSRASVEARRKAGETLRAVSVAIGGLDLGMGQAFSRALGRGVRLGSEGGRKEAAARGASRSEARPRGRDGTLSATDPSRDLPAVELPEHGLEPSAKPHTVAIGRARATVVSSEVGDNWVQVVSWVYEGGGEAGAYAQTVLGVGSPDVRARRCVRDPEGRAPTIERVEGARVFRYALSPDGGRTGFRALPVAGQAVPPEVLGLAHRPHGPRDPLPDAAIPADLVLLDVRPASSAPPADNGAGGAAQGIGEPPTVTLRLRKGAEAELAASFPRAVLQRLVLGREADLTPGRPLPGLDSPSSILGGRRALMVALGGPHAAPPWAVPADPVPGEEDGAQIAGALRRWWAADGVAVPVVVGSDAASSTTRWQAAPAIRGKALLLLPEDAFPALAAPLRSALAGAWPAKQVVSALPEGKLPDLVVLASAEAPGLLGARVRALARREAMRGKLLAVYSLSGPVRADLPALVLREAPIAGFGLASCSPVGWTDAPAALAALAGAIQSKPLRARRVEELPGPFLWHW